MTDFTIMVMFCYQFSLEITVRHSSAGVKVMKAECSGYQVTKHTFTSLSFVLSSLSMLLCHSYALAATDTACSCDSELQCITDSFRQNFG